MGITFKTNLLLCVCMSGGWQIVVQRATIINVWASLFFAVLVRSHQPCTDDFYVRTCFSASVGSKHKESHYGVIVTSKFWTPTT